MHLTQPFYFLIVIHILVLKLTGGSTSKIAIREKANKMQRGEGTVLMD
jgi:hypothetical protein